MAGRLHVAQALGRKSTRAPAQPHHPTRVKAVAQYGKTAISNADATREAELMDNHEVIAECEAKAEAAYAAMYDARPHGVKDLYDNARLYFRDAIDAAQCAGRTDDVTRLTSRVQHVEEVYISQFRFIGL